MTHKQWFNNVLHLHPVHEEGAGKRSGVNNHTLKGTLAKLLLFNE